MANRNFAQSQASASGNKANSIHATTVAPPPRSYFMSGIYPLDSASSNLSFEPISMPIPRQCHSHMTSIALEQYRLQLYNYALNLERLKCPQYGADMEAGVRSNIESSFMSAWPNAYSSSGSGSSESRLSTLSTISLFPQSQHIFQPEEPKPQHSYIGLIAMAILSSTEMKLVLSDIYQYILDNYSYFRSRGPGWRNSIRHNLSLNDCFIKSGRSANGKGHYWAIHPANMDDFRKGDFRRRKAQRKVRKHMGLSVDDASTDSPSPPPLDLTSSPPPVAQTSMQLAALNYPYHQHYIGHFFGRGILGASTATCNLPQYTATALQRQQIHIQQPEQHHAQKIDQIYQQAQHQHIAYINSTTTTTIANLYSQTRKRQFDVASLLAPDVQIVDIVEDEGASPPATRRATQTQHTVITKVQVQKQRTIHRELVVEPSLNTKASKVDTDADIEADIDVDGYEDRDGIDKVHGHNLELHSRRHLSTSEIQEILLPNDNNSYLSDAGESFDVVAEDNVPHDFSVSPPLDESLSSCHQDSNSVEESPSGPGTFNVMDPPLLASPLELTLSLPKVDADANQFDPHVLNQYYGTYMTTSPHCASVESTVQSKSKNAHPSKELLPTKL